ncbi:DUF2397 family protein [Nocardiopsis alba]|uniref:DUF2397 family protein n=1 Tax=Nocardiopsis alba TaxID=53437 RepID=UPI00034CD333|nr:DUF2397 family protein [Nocardiopsis alba]
MGLNQWANDRADERQDTGDRPVPRHGRAALLRLAAWFEEAEPDRADALATAAFALHPSRDLQGRVADGVAATTSWWQAEPDRSTVTEHPGTRSPEPVRDHRAQQARLRDAAESSAHWRRAGAEQVRSLLTEPTADRARLDLSGAGMEVLMELLTTALGSGDASRGPASAGDLEFGLRLHVHTAPGAEVVVRGEGGDLTLEGLRLHVTSYDQHHGQIVPPTPVEPLAEPEGEIDGPEGLDRTETLDVPEEPGSPETDETPEPEETTESPEAPETTEGSEETEAALEPETALEDDEASSPEAGDEGPERTDSLPGPDPDAETTGPIEIITHTPRTRR